MNDIEEIDVCQKATFYNSCRTCLKFLNNEENNKFQIFEYVLDSLLLKEILVSVCSIQVEHDDSLPKIMCIACLSRLCDAYNFIKICKNSETVIKGTGDTPNQIILKIEQNVKDPIETCEEDPEENQSVVDADEDNAQGDNYSSSNSEEQLLFECTSCDKSFKSKQGLCSHQRVHSIKSEEYHGKCELCEEDVDSLKDLITHMEDEHSEERPYLCKKCGKGFSQLNSLRKHMQSRHPKSEPSFPAKTLQCPHCDRVFSSQSSLHYHKLTHSDPQFTCDICGRNYVSRSSLKLHMKTHSDEQYECADCSKVFVHKRSMEVHVKTHTGEKPFECVRCGRRFAQKAHLTTHIRTHTGEKPYQCGYCPKRFTVTSNRKLHEKTMHLGVKRNQTQYRKYVKREDGGVPKPKQATKGSYVCEECGKHFTILGSFRTHKLMHSSVRAHACDVCHKTFRQLSHLKVHKGLHTGEKPHVCDICGKCFRVRSNLNVHYRKHTGEKPYECMVCMKRFADATNMKKHQETHANRPVLVHDLQYADVLKEMVVEAADGQEIVCEVKVLNDEELEKKPHVCPVCGKHFAQKKDVTVHMRLHNGERPYKCHFCDKTFNVRSNWRVHMRRHTGDRRFRCKICSKEFYESNTLNRHMKVHRNDESAQPKEETQENEQETEGNEPELELEPEGQDEQILIEEMDY